MEYFPYEIYVKKGPESGKNREKNPTSDLRPREGGNENFIFTNGNFCIKSM
jgi:hypothetical protein